MNHYNYKANTRIDECDVERKKLTEIIAKISVVQGYIDK